MQKVFLDEEAVEFQGPPPSSIPELEEVLQSALAPMGRCLVRIEERKPETGLAAASEIHAYSQSHASSLAQLWQKEMEREEWKEENWRHLARILLQKPWSEAHQCCMRQMEILAGWVQLMETTANFARQNQWPVSEGLFDLVPRGISVCNAILEAFEARKSLPLAETLALELPSWLQDTGQVLDSSILPFLLSQPE